MTKTTVHLVTSIQNCTLMVFHTDAHCWEFRVVSPGGAVFGERKIYYSAEAAEKAGREWIEKGS
ncbi:MAG: hypothetical protein KME22_13435 [Hassallia sp. WJT32-NPBG1]|jgi:UDP-N-acetylglucosamine enolpyruvyl transferase|nr:hypothetical protein [Hassallia sp. WJT32-NPBG1]